MRSLVLTIAVLVCFPPPRIGAQNQTATVRVQVRTSEKPVEDAEVVVAGTTHRTDAAGTTTIITVPGTVDITVLKSGFAPTTVSVQVAAGATQDVVVDLQAQPTVEETVTVVASTRTDKRLEDQPMRVEVLAREEIEEKMLMTPGDIVMMLNEMGGVRVQATSPSLGAASVRIQGMPGRYTRVLADGLPLFGEVGGLGLLQIPPMDLGQVRVLDGDQFLVRIFLGESDKWRHTPLARAILERLRGEGFAGATVVHGVAGFGASSVIHTAGLIELSADLPVVIEVVDDQAHVDRLLPILDEMITGGALVTMERVRVLKYAAGQKRARDAPSSQQFIRAAPLQHPR
jgi:PII-like signaling protein